MRDGAEATAHGRIETAEGYILTTPAIPLPWPLGFRSETLRPPLSVEVAFSVVMVLIGIFAKTLILIFSGFVGSLPLNFRQRFPRGFGEAQWTLARAII